MILPSLVVTRSRLFKSVYSSSIRNMSAVKITEGVEFETIAREWRFKWSADNDKSSLAAAQKALLAVKPKIASIDGVKSVQRVVCGGCLDFKVVIALPIEKFKAWEATQFTPEAEFLAAVKNIPGISVVETQTYTLESVL